MRKITFLTLSAIFFAIGFFSVLAPQNRITKCANSISCIKNLDTQVNNDETGTFLGENILVPKINLALETANINILGTQDPQVQDDAEQKHIYVDLSEQKFYAYEGTKLYFSTLTSTGRWGKTPTGEFTIWIKIRATKMSGGSGNDYYYLPNVPYVMYFYNSKTPKSMGYGIHGTYWHNNFGHEMSHGCVNLRTIDAKKMYEWVNPVTQSTTTYATANNPGTKLTICNQLEIKEGETPKCLE